MLATKASMMGLSVFFLVLSIYTLVASSMQEVIFLRYLDRCMRSWKCVQLTQHQPAPKRKDASPRPSSQLYGSCRSLVERYVEWISPAVLAIAISLVLVCIVLVCTPHQPRTHHAFVMLAAVLSVAGLVISSIHLAQIHDDVLGVLGTEWKSASGDCADRRPNDDHLRWASASIVACFGMVALVSMPWVATTVSSPP